MIKLLLMLPGDPTQNWMFFLLPVVLIVFAIKGAQWLNKWYRHIKHDEGGA